MFPSIKLSDIPKRQRGIIRSPSGTRPILWKIEENGLRLIIKDFSRNGFLFRNTVGRFLIWRESKAYGMLRGIQGVPSFYGTIGGLALVVEEIEGKDLESVRNGEELPEDFFKRLRALIDEIHKRGMAHCDLKRAPNIILGNDGAPCIVDWSASICKKELGFFPLSPIFNRFVRDDLNAITKISLKYRPEIVSPKEKQQYFHRSRAEIVIRSLRDRARAMLKKIA